MAEETGVPCENHRLTLSHWQLSQIPQQIVIYYFKIQGIKTGLCYMLFAIYKLWYKEGLCYMLLLFIIQGSKTDGDLVRRLRDELENSRIQLERKEQEISAMDIHGAENRSEIEKKDRELREKVTLEFWFHTFN